MWIYKFAPISARCFPTVADLNNPWIFPKDVAVVVSVTHNYDAGIKDEIESRGMKYFHYPLYEEVDDIGWENVQRAVSILLQYDSEGKRMVVHCDFGQHRSRLVVETFHYAKLGAHLHDEYKGYDNHLIYDCCTEHLPPLNVVERVLLSLQHKI